MRKLKIYEGFTLNLELSSCETFKLPVLIVFSSSTQTILTCIKRSLSAQSDHQQYRLKKTRAKPHFVKDNTQGSFIKRAHVEIVLRTDTYLIHIFASSDLPFKLV